MSKRRNFTPGVAAEIMRRACLIDECGKPLFGLGLCQAHYYRLRRHGNPLGGGTGKGVLRKFVERAKQYEGDQCLLWPYGHNGEGYGLLRINKKSVLAHRMVCESVNGPAERGQLALHSCGNGHLGCVTPKHLRWGTVKENSADAARDGVAPIGERNGNAKLTSDDVAKIRTMLGKAKQKDIAKQFGVKRQTITNISIGVRWRAAS